MSLRGRAPLDDASVDGRFARASEDAFDAYLAYRAHCASSCPPRARHEGAQKATARHFVHGSGDESGFAHAKHAVGPSSDARDPSLRSARIESTTRRVRARLTVGLAVGDVTVFFATATTDSRTRRRRTNGRTVYLVQMYAFNHDNSNGLEDD